MLLAKILVSLSARKHSICPGGSALFAMLLVHSARSLAEYRDAPERIACEQAAHAPPAGSPWRRGSIASMQRSFIYLGTIASSRP